jgi:gliding motility-associated-like protein
MLDPSVPITESQPIYVYAATTTTPSCSSEQSFTVTINQAPVLDAVFDISTCENTVLLPALTVGTYYTAPGGPTGTGSVIDPAVALTSNQTVYVYAANGDCVAEASFEVTLGEYVVTTPGNQIHCDNYTLPDLAPGVNYYTDVNGTGTMLNAGDVITESTTLHVYGVQGACSDDETFTITINTAVADVIDNVSACESYMLPALSANNTYWSVSGGPSGGGVQYNAGDVISSVGDTTIWIWAESGTTPNCTDESSFVVTIGQVTADVLPDVTVCDHYILPALNPGNAYWTGPGATGQSLAAGFSVDSSQLIYIYAGDASCNDQSSFFVTVNITPQLTPIQSVTACDSYTLPSPQAGAPYYSATGGVGQLSDNEVINTVGDTTIYEYAQTGTTPDICFAEVSFTVSITASPSVSQMPNVSACDSYVLDAPASGTVYTQQNGAGTAYDLTQPVTQTTTFYVYAANGSCSDQTSFTVSITPSPAFTIDSGCQGAVFVLTANPTNFDASTASFAWSAGAGGQVVSTDGASATVSGAATYSVVVTSGDCTSSAQTIAVDNTGCLIQKGISPNGDGMNDTFDLAGQNVSHLEIFNRYGTKVYERSNYTNQWGGQSDKGDELPDGVYYYVIKYTAGDTKTGWIYINREQN